MKNSKPRFRQVSIAITLFSSLAVLSTQLFAGPSLQFYGDNSKDKMVTSGKIGYVGGDTRIGVNFDKDLQGQVDLSQVISEDDKSSTSAEGWLGYNLKSDDEVTKGVKGAGIKLNHLWVDDSAEMVHKVFGAYDKNKDSQAKATFGYGQEQEELFWSGHVSKGIGGGTVIGDVNTLSYDYGVGGEAGTFLEDSLTRVRGGVNYQFATNFNEAEESRPSQVTLSAGVEQFFQDSPHSVSLDVSGNKKSGGDDADNSNFNARVGYRYEFGGNGVFQSDRKAKRTRIEVPGKARIAARAAVPEKYKRQAIKTNGLELVKTTMKLENETFFEKNSSKLTTSAIQNLNNISKQIKSSGYLGSLRVTGHTCGLGSVAYDQKLSEKRAKEVRDYLVTQGIKSKRLQARGLGKGSPKYVKKDTGFKNRRVDIEYVTERSVKKRVNRVKYKNVLVQKGTPARAEVPGTLARYIWKTEYVKTAPVWIKRALHNPIRHSTSVDTYSTRSDQAVHNDIANAVAGNTIIDVLGNDSAGVVLQSVTQPPNGTVNIVGGQVVYVANVGFSGVDVFTYTVLDKNGKQLTSTVTVNVPVAVNNLPIATNDVSATNEDTLVLINVLANDSDPDGDVLTISNLTVPNDGVVVVVAGQVQYTPNNNFSGVDNFQYTISDGNGNSATASVVVTVTNVNKAPVAVDDNNTTNENVATTIVVTANDTDPDGDALTLAGMTNPSNGVVAQAGNDITYTPNIGFAGNDQFDYTISDGNGHTATATVFITVNNVNAAPVANNDSIVTNLNTSTTIVVLANDTDADGDVLTITNITVPNDGTAVQVGNNILYTPDNGFSGDDVFFYTISDGNGGTSTAMVNVAVNLPPIAVDDAANTVGPAPVTIFVLVNDTDPDAAPGHGVCLNGIQTHPLNGSLSWDATTITYEPNGGFAGIDTFVYIACDTDGATDTAMVTVTVN